MEDRYRTEWHPPARGQERGQPLEAGKRRATITALHWTLNSEVPLFLDSCIRGDEGNQILSLTHISSLHVL